MTEFLMLGKVMRGLTWSTTQNPSLTPASIMRSAMGPWP
jgi:hypothetical protein